MVRVRLKLNCELEGMKLVEESQQSCQVCQNWLMDDFKKFDFIFQRQLWCKSMSRLLTEECLKCWQSQFPAAREARLLLRVGPKVPVTSTAAPLDHGKLGQVFPRCIAWQVFVARTQRPGALLNTGLLLSCFVHQYGASFCIKAEIKIDS